MVVEQNKYQQPTVGKLLKHLIIDMNNLITQHIELFKYEIKEDIAIIWQYTGIIIAGALIAYTVLIFFGFFVIFALALILPLWASSLVVMLLYIMIAVISLVIAKDYLKKAKTKSDITINEAKKTMEEAKKWLQELK
ncbi:MAG: phage holin family protein [bacterium]